MYSRRNTLRSFEANRAGYVPRILLGLFACLLTMSAQGQSILEVETFRWTNFVDRKTRTYAQVHVSPTRVKDIYLWTQLKGSPELLAQLIQTGNGKVRIRHQWFSYDSDRIYAEQDAAVDLEVGRKEELKKLAYEVDALGFFRWRVWSSRQNLSRGLWRVDIVTDEGEPVMCPSPDAAVPCQIFMEIE